MNPNIFPRYMVNPNNFINRIYPLERNANIFSRLRSGIGAIKWRQLFNGANQTINFVNQTIPLIQKTRPMIDNLKSIVQISRELNKDTNHQKNYSNNSNTIKENNKEEILTQEILIQEKKEESLNKPNFFI